MDLEVGLDRNPILIDGVTLGFLDYERAREVLSCLSVPSLPTLQLDFTVSFCLQGAQFQLRAFFL